MAKRKRETWPSSELVHIWANQGEERGRARGTPLKFEGPVIRYSGTVLGIVDKEKDVALTNSTRFDGGRGWGGRPENGWSRAVRSAVLGYKERVKVPYYFLSWVLDRKWKPGPGGNYSTVWVLCADGTSKPMEFTADDYFSWVLGRLFSVRRKMDEKVRKAKAQRYYYMNWGLESGMREAEECFLGMVAMGMLEPWQVELFQDVKVRLQYTEEEKEAAKAYSAKWEAVDSKRVKEHGAFGRESYEKRRERQKRAEERIRKRLTVTGDQWRELVEKRSVSVEERERAWKEYEGGSVGAPPNPRHGLSWDDGGRYVVQTLGVEAKSVDWRPWPNEKGTTGPTYYAGANDRVLLAYRSDNGGQVITSLGAVVPVGQAVRLLRLVERVRMGGEGYKVEGGDGEKHKFGYYKLSEITKDGDVRIGCHYITWPVIEEFRPRLMRIWETVREGGEKES